MARADSIDTTTASVSDAHAHLIQRLITRKPHQIRYSADARDLEERAAHVQAIGNAHSAGRAVRREATTGSYIYAIIVDGVVRYIGKGRNGRMYTHLIEAKRTSARCPANTAHLSPRMHRKLVETVRAGSQITETVITSCLSDWATYQLESRMISEFHKFRPGQLWNTIDERFLGPRYLPDEWNDPENPLYRLRRPLGDPHPARGWARSCRPAACRRAPRVP
jgi:hypothetical protein